MKPRNTKRLRELRNNAVGIWDDGKMYLTLKQKNTTGVTESCPFCGKRHTHGIGPGHRVVHCALNEEEVFENLLGQEFRSSDGYILICPGV